MGLTKEEKVRVRGHMGYGAFTSASTFFLGTPAAVETSFIIEPAMDRILPEAEPYVRELIVRLDAVLNQIAETNENVQVTSLGEIDLNDKHDSKMWDRYLFWQGKLADALGVPPNPYTKTQGTIGGGGINTPVAH